MRKLIMLTSLLLTLFCVTTARAYTQYTAKVSCDGNPVVFEAGPYIIDGSTMIPVRTLSQAIGYDISWDSALNTVIVTSPVATAWLQADNPVVTVNKNGVMYSKRCDVAPCIIDDRIFVPLRVLAEIFDAVVQWDATTSGVSIYTYAYGGPNNAETPGSQAESQPVVPVVAGEASVTIEGFVPPVDHIKGNPHVLSGSVSCQQIFDRINIKVIDTESGAVEINETAFDINSSVYSFADIDSRVRFGVLSLGKKSFEITCVDKNEARKTFTYEFVVREPQGAKLKVDVDMLWPVPASSLITTIFWCDNPFCHSNAGRANGHAAIDISADEGEDVIAVADGVVELQGFGSYENSRTGYGNFILLDHGNGLKTQYSHLHEIFVTDGQQVKAGDVIGSVGNTGNSTGNHLDFYISQDGVRCDPLYYLDIPASARCWEECDDAYFKKALAERNNK